MRLIDGDAVIEHAEVNGEDREFIRILTDYIEEADAVEPKQEWIPCSERLPSKGVPVLVNGIMEDAPPITISTDAPLYYENGWINAWMPLPEPWEGADNETN